MTESTEQTAPSLGTPTDSPVGVDATNTRTDGTSTADELAGPDRTMDTPDELGGTGGEQAGGAG